MKKTILPTLCVCAAALFFSGCGEKQSVIPDTSAVQSVLQNANYVVSVSSQDVNGMALTAKKGDDFLAYYKLDTAEECDRLYDVVIGANPDADVSCKYTNDENFGNVIICGTKNCGRGKKNVLLCRKNGRVSNSPFASRKL